MLLSIIIVNYKSTQYILDCLNSAGAELLQNDAIEWFVVDNDSKDDSENIICSKFPFVQYIQMGYNAGFARANNAALRLAKGAHVLLLNPDTLLPKNSITTCVERLAASSHIACGVQLVHADLSPQFSGSNFTLGGLNHLLELPYWGAAIKGLATFLKKSKPSLIHVEKETKVDWVSGAFLMVKRQAVDQAGLMDEDFFLYAEEVEWCSRLRKIGTICLYGDIQVIHLIGTSIQSATSASDNSYTNLSDKKGLQLMVSNHLRIRKQYGIFWFLILLLNYTWAIPYSIIASILMNCFNWKSLVAEMRYLSGFTKNVLTVWTVIPRIIQGKKYFYKFI
jgi:GT2 family glycosyltransferase